MTTQGPIRNLSTLIERLDAIHEDLDARHLNADQYDELGWARRPIEALIEQCREEAAARDWSRRNVDGFARVLPKGARA